MAFPPGFLDELRSRLSLAELVGRRVRLTRRGREYGGLCPFHNEKTPSFYVVEDKGFFHCFGCGAHGDAIGFAMRADNLDFIEAVERLAGEAGIAVPQQTPHEREQAQRQKTLLEALVAAADFYEGQLWAPGGARAREYLARRGLDEETIRRFRLGWAPDDRQSLRRALSGEYPEVLLREAGLVRVPDDGGTPYDYFRSRVIFPIGDRRGRPIAFGGRTLPGSSPGTSDQPKYLNSPDTPLFEKGRVLYGWAAARTHLARVPDSDPTATAIVVEGYMDVIALHRAGFGGAVAPLGTALTEAQLQELWRLSTEPVLCFDGDAAGQRAAWRALQRALPLLQPGRSLHFATLPPGDDPDSLVRGAGAAAVSGVLAAARALSEVLWQQELAARPIDTPERRADLERRLTAQAELIADRIVQNEYHRFFRDRLFALGRSARPVPLQRGRVNAKFNIRADFAYDFSLPASPGRRNRELLLGLLIAHPAFIERLIEEIAAVEMPEPALDSLRSSILDIANTHPGLDGEAFRQHLVLCGHTEIVDALAITIAKHAGFAAHGGNEPEVIERGLRETLLLLHAARPENGMRTNSPAPTEPADAEFADAELERLTALMEQKLQDAPIGGTE
jgi:DNA primase